MLLLLLQRNADAFLSVVSVVFISTCCPSSAGTTFEGTVLWNGTAACATGGASSVIDGSQLLLLLLDAGSDVAIRDGCAPSLGPLCAWKCSIDVHCTNFNFWLENGTCELFHHVPRYCSVEHGCRHFQVGIGVLK